jgi:hypothetical protein
MCPERKKKQRDLNQGNEQAMLLVHLVLSIVPGTIIPEMQEENVTECDHT